MKLIRREKRGLLTFFLLSVLLVRLSGFPRFRVFSALGILVAFEHVGFNLISLLGAYGTDPGQIPEGLSKPLFGLFMSYMFGLPVVLLIGFLGSSLGSRR
ncbi:hypothetical protein EBZ37_12755 [bacterium]|nr:hypothetical protein [bacterium]